MTIGFGQVGGQFQWYETGELNTTGPVLVVTGFLRLVPRTVTTLGTASVIGTGALSFVTDATSTTFMAIATGGGTNSIVVFSDGTSWRIG